MSLHIRRGESGDHDIQKAHSARRLMEIVDGLRAERGLPTTAEMRAAAEAEAAEASAADVPASDVPTLPASASNGDDYKWSADAT